MPTLTRPLFSAALARELYDQDTPRFERNQERMLCRLTAEKIVDRWSPLMPLPTTQGQIREVAKRIKAETFRPEDIAEIVAPVVLR